ncbi:MAG TPA: MBL fold metallo-hydrolase [Aliidongia sp.]|uniref:MBL fold metallo-hydrolase n=1 Tax=Aliidongia sp. TaxID=1914230 RepID=UPI002DDCDEE5|nr:MBL fold metallo-hydrolase [Aliidongia sp.]HEV2675459.1 MBL fold metallo-hydrolase [Aliidongia sp.]
MTPDVTGFFDETTKSVSYLVADPQTGAAAIIDPVLDFDLATGATSTPNADRIADMVERRRFDVQWLLETHIHADHLSAGAYLKQRLGGNRAIGAGVRQVHTAFREAFALDPAGALGFDHLFEPEETFRIGGLAATALATPGHTPACISYLIGDAVFLGDTLFMPDCGTARADFPGGDAAMLYRSIRRILGLPEATRLFVGHDYPPVTRRPDWMTSVPDERAGNTHVHDGIDEAAFVAMRRARDATLELPRLFHPAVRFNLGGELPRG